ncbi:MAG: PAS domain S-box protein [Blastocatellia bacterium]
MKPAAPSATTTATTATPFQAVFGLSFDAVLVLDRDGIVVDANPAAVRLFGRRRATIVGRPVARLLRESDASVLPAPGTRSRRPITFLQSRGGTVECDVAVSEDIDGAGRVLIARDASELLSKGLALEASELELSEINRALDASAIVAMTDRRGQILFVNDKFCKISKYSEAELIGQDHRIINSGHHSKEFFREMWQTILSGKIWRDDIRNRAKDGSFYWVDTTIVPSLDGNGEPFRFVAIRYDISGRKAYEEELIRSEERFARAFDGSPHPMAITQLHSGTFINVNDCFLQLVGATREEVIGKNSGDIGIWTEPEMRSEYVTRLKAEGSIQNYETRLRNRQGVIRTVLASAEVIDVGGEQCILTAMVDLTEKKRLEAQFLRAQRMESIGTLAGGIAHDLNNVLSPILMSIQLLQTRTADASSLELLETLEASAQRGSEMVNQVLTFARGASGERLVLQPKHIVKEAVKILRDTLPKSIEISQSIGSDLWTVRGDPTQLYQILMNLSVNARDAMPHGGRLIVSAANVTVDENYSRMNIDSRPGRFVSISVEDTGVGIPENIIGKIFDPFFTTKEQGKGTGIGLSTVIGIVKGHEGFINVYSEPGRGTTFRVYIPAADVAIKSTAVRDEPLPRGTGERILVVDDESPVRDVTRRTLEEYGYAVETAADGAEAVAVYAKLGGSVKLVLLDMMMPVMDGAMTIRALRKLDPGVRIIATSGIAGHALDPEGSLGLVEAFLQKPYTADRLLRTIAIVLAGPIRDA